MHNKKTWILHLGGILLGGLIGFMVAVFFYYQKVHKYEVMTRDALHSFFGSDRVHDCLLYLEPIRNGNVDSSIYEMEFKLDSALDHIALNRERFPHLTDASLTDVSSLLGRARVYRQQYPIVKAQCGERITTLLQLKEKPNKPISPDARKLAPGE